MKWIAAICQTKLLFAPVRITRAPISLPLRIRWMSCFVFLSNVLCMRLSIHPSLKSAYENCLDKVDYKYTPPYLSLSIHMIQTKILSLNSKYGTTQNRHYRLYRSRNTLQDCCPIVVCNKTALQDSFSRNFLHMTTWHCNLIDWQWWHLDTRQAQWMIAGP